MVERERVLLTVDKLHVERARVAERRHALQVLDLAEVPDLAGARGEGAHDLVLEVAQLVEIDRRLLELNAEVLRVGRLGDDVGHVEERLGRNAPAVDADTAGILLGIDERDLHPPVGRIERRRVPTRPCSDYNQLCRSRHIKTNRRARSSGELLIKNS